jgi:hypothetical protein
MTEEYWGKRPIKHTPGPWPYQYTGDHKRILIGKGLVEGPGGYEVAEVYSDDCPSEVAEANARLISAAPELLEACQLYRMFVEVMNDGPDDSDKAMAEGFLVRAHALAKDAIAKANGNAGKTDTVV